MDRQSKHSQPGLDPASNPALPRAVPGRLFGWVKLVAWIESALFAGLLFVWLAPGMDGETAVLGLSHGLGYLALCALILVAVLAREAPWPLLAASLTPVGPFGTVIGIALIEHRGWGVDPPEGRPERIDDRVLTPRSPNVDNQSAGRK